MTKFGIFVAVSMAMLAPVVTGCAELYANQEGKAIRPIAEQRIVEVEENGKPVDGMFFSTENAVESYEYDEVGVIVYDCPDANLYDVEIYFGLCEPEDTYYDIVSAISEGREINGHLEEVGTLDDGSPVFTLIYDVD